MGEEIIQREELINEYGTQVYFRHKDCNASYFMLRGEEHKKAFLDAVARGELMRLVCKN